MFQLHPNQVKLKNKNEKYNPYRKCAIRCIDGYLSYFGNEIRICQKQQYRRSSGWELNIYESLHDLN